MEEFYVQIMNINADVDKMTINRNESKIIRIKNAESESDAVQQAVSRTFNRCGFFCEEIIGDCRYGQVTSKNYLGGANLYGKIRVKI